MAKKGKRWRANRDKYDKQQRLEPAEAFKLLKSMQSAKFDETVDVAVRLGVNPKKSDQMVRGVVSLPHGTGKTVRILVFASGEQEKAAREAGADFVGGDDLVEKIKGGWLDFDKAIATPDMMGKVGAIARILGPRGLMPNPKVGTVTKDVAKAISEQKAGSVEFRVEKAGIIHCGIGKLSFEATKLEENFTALMDQIVKLKPATAKGTYLQATTVSSTMGPGIKVDIQKAQTAATKG